MIAKDAATKLAAARTRLILDKPFLGALVLRLPMQEAGSGWCRTTATECAPCITTPPISTACPCRKPNSSSPMRPCIAR